MSLISVYLESLILMNIPMFKLHETGMLDKRRNIRQEVFWHSSVFRVGGGDRQRWFSGGPVRQRSV